MKGQQESFLHSVYGKLIAAFIIGVVAIGAASLISKLGFRDMLQTVESLSAPNDKLRIVNSLFYRLSQLEQLQHANAIENPAKSAETTNPEIQAIMTSIDSLRFLCQDYPAQLERVDSMAQILQKRQKLSASYFALRAELDTNKQLNSQVLSLTKKLSTMKPEEDKRVVTTTNKRTTTSILEAKKRKELKKAAAQTDNRPFFKRLFSANPEKKKLKRGAQQVKEDVQVKVDTIYEGRKYHSIIKVERDLRVVERNFHQKNAELLARELALVKTSHQLNRKLLDILKAFEEEEMGQVKGDYFKATSVVNFSVKRMNIIAVIFFLGSGLFVFLIVLDISRSHKLRKALQRAKEEAEHLSQVKQRFLANMSHELRTPLQSILGFSEQVRGQQKPKPEALDAIFFSAEHLLQIVNEVLDYSRIISGKFTFEKKPFDVQQLASEVVATLMPQASKKNLQLALNIDCKTTHTVSGDPFRLRQVLYNVIGNAIKFTDKGAVSLTLNCKTEGENTMYSFTVKDSGIGIPEADISRIFNQFEQSSGNDVQKHGGTGLGLSIVKSLVESQGGSLNVSSKLGEGSIFEVNLPYQIQEKQAGLVYNKTKVSATTFDGEILVVDDDAIILKLCGAILDKYHLKNTCIRSSKKAAEMEWSKDLKVVFTDIQMPEMNGFELCKALKKKLSSDVKIYALTARALPEEHQAILAQGFDGILMKPFREQELLEVLNSIPQTLKKGLLEDFTSDFGAIGLVCGADEQMFQSMLQLFVTEARTDLELLNLYLAGNLPEQVMEIVHKLGGCVGQLGATQLGEKLKSHEQDLKASVPLSKINSDLIHTISEVEKLVEIAQIRINTFQEA